MPFGSRINNFAAIISGGFIIASVLVSIIGMVISNRRIVEITHGNQAAIIKQNEKLSEEHREILMIIYRLEAHILGGKTE